MTARPGAHGLHLRAGSEDRGAGGLSALQFKQLGDAVTRLEVMVDRLEKRLWLAVYGVAAAVLAEAGYSILKMTHLGGG